MRITKRPFLVILFIALSAQAGPGRKYKRMSTPKFPRMTTTEYCPKLFEKDWSKIDAALEDPIEKQGRKFGVGTHMKIRVDNGNTAEGIFLGRLVNMENYRTTKYMFYDYEGGKVYLLDQAKTEIKFEGGLVGNRSLQPIAMPKEQVGETCSAYSIAYFLRQMHVNGFVGTGKLAEKLSSKAGIGDIMAMAMNDYYLYYRGADFETVFRKLSDDFGMKCHELKYKSVDGFVNAMQSAMAKGSPVLLEFYIGPNMITTDHQWVDPDLRHGEDRRIWGPRAVGQRSSGGHAVVATEFFTSPSGRKKLLVGDPDWPDRPIIWDVHDYVVERKKSGGLQAHVCFPK